MRSYYHSSKLRIVEGDGRSGRAVQEVQRHSVAPDGGAALYDDERASGDLGQWRQRLRRSNWCLNAYRVDNLGQRDASGFRPNTLETSQES